VLFRSVEADVVVLHSGVQRDGNGDKAKGYDGFLRYSHVKHLNSTIVFTHNGKIEDENIDREAVILPTVHMHAKKNPVLFGRGAAALLFYCILSCCLRPSCRT